MRQNVCSFFGHLKSTSASQNQLARPRILCLFLFESSEKIFERPKNWFGRRKNAGFLLTPINLLGKVIKIVQISGFCRANASLKNVILQNEGDIEKRKFR